MSQNNDEENLSFKLITLGNAGVGKTSILQRYLYDKFNINSESTIGIELSYKEIILENNERVTLKIIDTCGQEKYRSLSKSYFKNTDGVLFVFDLSNIESFKEITDWIKLFNENHNGKEKVPKCLVGSKCDLEKKVTDDKIKEVSQKYNLHYYETSAKDNFNINKLFEDMSKILYENKKLNKNEKQKSIKIINQKIEEKPKKRNCCDLRSDIYEITKLFKSYNKELLYK